MKRILTIFLIAMLPMMAMSQKPITRPGKNPQKQTVRQNNSGGKKKRVNTGNSNRNNARQTVSQPTPAPPAKLLTGTINGYDWVDLGLSVKWATQNVGASSPSDYGGYYAWGETETKSSYDWDNCFDCLDNTGDSWGIYKNGGKTSISPTSGHDAARENWGGSWRMPTDAEFDELRDKCDWTWTSQGGHNGYLVTSKTNGKSIFLPAAGWRFLTGTVNVGEVGNYWSSTLSSSYSYNARNLYFNCSNHNTSNNYRRYGQSVRPVTDSEGAVVTTAADSWHDKDRRAADFWHDKNRK